MRFTNKNQTLFFDRCVYIENSINCPNLGPLNIGKLPKAIKRYEKQAQLHSNELFDTEIDSLLLFYSLPRCFTHFFFIKLSWTFVHEVEEYIRKYQLINLTMVTKTNSLVNLSNGLRLGPTLLNSNRIDISKFSTLQHQQTTLLNNAKLQDISNSITSRNVTKYSWNKGKRKTVRVVLKKFYRLNWGCWIHTKCGRQKKIWKKHAARKRRLRQHVLCNASQSRLLDKMVNMYWRKPKHYVEDPYEPYHTREEHLFTYKKPRPFIPLESNPAS